MKITTEKLPKSLLAMDIELDHAQIEKGLDQAARRLSQKHTIPGFRKGKAPRFIIENYFGRDAVMEEASNDLINKAFKKAMEQEDINPVGQPSLVSIHNDDDGFRFRVTVPVSPTLQLADYRSIRKPLEIEPVTDEVVERALDMQRDKHVALRELDEPRPAQDGDQLVVKQEVLIDGQRQHDPDDAEEDGEPAETTVVLQDGRLISEYYQGLLGVQVDESRTITARIPDDHENTELRGKEVTFNVQVMSIQERILPEWEELPELENFDGTLDDLRQSIREKLEDSSRSMAETYLYEQFLEEVIAGSEFDIADATIAMIAEQILNQQVKQFEQYGITMEQMLEVRGITLEEAVEEFVPVAEQQAKTSMVTIEMGKYEQLTVSDDDIEAQIQEMISDYPAEQHEQVATFLRTNMHEDVVRAVLDHKLRERVIQIATDQAPPLPDNDAASSDESDSDAA